MKLKKYENNPVLKPVEGSRYEGLYVCNPGVWYEDGVFYMLYRSAGDDEEHYIHMCLAKSTDGYNFERVCDKPVFSPSADGFDGGSVEDARIIKLGKFYYVTYAYRAFPPGRYWTFPPDVVQKPDSDEFVPKCYRENVGGSAVAITKDFKSFVRLGRVTDPNEDDRDVVIFPEKCGGKYVMLHRPKERVGEKYGCEKPSIFIKFADDLMSFPKESTLLLKAQESWEKDKMGAAAPPSKTKYGWLMLYHAVSEGLYRVGAVMLDGDNPQRVIARCPHPIMEPEEPYEISGPYSGCVFPTGNAVVDGTLYVYYGAADKYCALATAPLDELCEYIMKYKI